MAKDPRDSHRFRPVMPQVCCTHADRLQRDGIDGRSGNVFRFFSFGCFDCPSLFGDLIGHSPEITEINSNLTFRVDNFKVLIIYEQIFIRDVMSKRALRPVSDSCEIDFIDEVKVRRVRREMKPDAATKALAETFRILGDPTRVKVAFALSREELCVCDLANLLGSSQSAISHSLRALRQMRLVRFRKQGKIAYYKLDDEHIDRLLQEGFRHIEEFLD